jgi:hypothetical protein
MVQIVVTTIAYDAEREALRRFVCSNGGWSFGREPLPQAPRPSSSGSGRLRAGGSRGHRITCAVVLAVTGDFHRFHRPTCDPLRRTEHRSLPTLSDEEPRKSVVKKEGARS